MLSKLSSLEKETLRRNKKKAPHEFTTGRLFVTNEWQNGKFRGGERGNLW